MDASTGTSLFEVTADMFLLTSLTCFRHCVRDCDVIAFSPVNNDCAAINLHCRLAVPRKQAAFVRYSRSFTNAFLHIKHHVFKCTVAAASYATFWDQAESAFRTMIKHFCFWY